MNICPRCRKADKSKQTTMDVTHKMFSENITVTGVPVLVCECGDINYMYPRELDFLLRDAYRNKLNVIPFKLNE